MSKQEMKQFYPGDPLSHAEPNDNNNITNPDNDTESTSENQTDNKGDSKNEGVDNTGDNTEPARESQTDNEGDSKNEGIDNAGDNTEPARESQTNNESDSKNEGINNTSKSAEKTENGLSILEKNQLLLIYINQLKELISTEKYKQEIESIKKEKKKAERLYNFWEKKLDELEKTYNDSVIYEYDNIVESNDEIIIKSRKSISIALEGSSSRNKEKLPGILKPLLKISKSMTKNADLWTVEGVAEDSGRLFINTGKIDKKEIPVYNGLLRSIFMTNKNLEKGIEKLLFIDNKINATLKELFIPLEICNLKVFDIEDRINDLFEKTEGQDKESIFNSIKEDVKQYVNDKLKKDHDHTKTIYNDVNNFQKDMLEFFNISLIKAYNTLERVGRDFNSLVNKEGNSAKQQWGVLINDLLKLIEKRLKSYSIFKMEVKEGDIFDPNIHEPVSEAERDENFKDDQIKSIEATGFQMTANINKNEETTIVLKSTEVIIVKN